MRFLLDRVADLASRDEEFSGTPLDWARYTKRWDAVELLESLGAAR